MKLNYEIIGNWVFLNFDEIDAYSDCRNLIVSFPISEFKFISFTTTLYKFKFRIYFLNLEQFDFEDKVSSISAENIQNSIKNLIREINLNNVNVPPSDGSTTIVV